MVYMVLDLEWNQPPPYRPRKALASPLRNEIIQIGAVMLDPSFKPIDEFRAAIRPVYNRVLHAHVAKLTGLEQADLDAGMPFSEAISLFRQWCGNDNCTILTWGNDDVSILQQNMAHYALEQGWIAAWYNLQPIYNRQMEAGKNQVSLKNAAAALGVDLDIPAHDALNDARITALICGKLDLQAGLAAAGAEANNETSVRKLQARLSLLGFKTKKAVLADPRVTTVICPVCHAKMESLPFASQSRNKMITLSTCAEHGTYFVRIKMACLKDNGWTVHQLVYNCDDEARALYAQKSAPEQA
ncbi:MAG: exonuclease domain-containing protein [Clostridia bacterium]|nr:exonuclease domain-containing protein [Clostridia bacterium]